LRTGQGGCWYCACYDEKRDARVSLRAERVASLVRVEGRQPLPHIPLAEWLDVVARDDGSGLPLPARGTTWGMTSYDLRALFGSIRPDGRGGA
jgi:hypothetical protein